MQEQVTKKLVCLVSLQGTNVHRDVVVLAVTFFRNEIS